MLAAFGGPQQVIRTAQWDWSLVERRFDDVLFRGYGGQPVIDGATMLLALIALVGFAVLARRRGGLTVFAGLFAGTVLVEGTLFLMGRFSHLRYNQFGLLFLLTAVAAGIVTCARLLGTFNRASGLATAGLLSSAVVACFATGVVGYAEHGRPDWPAVARAVAAVGGREADVVTSNQWAQLSIGYYLGRYRSLREAPWGVPTVFDDRGQLMQQMARQRAGCVLVLAAGFATSDDLFAGLRPKHPILSLPDSDRARLFRFAAGETPRQACFPPADFRVEPSPGYGSLLPWLARSRSGA